MGVSFLRSADLSTQKKAELQQAVLLLRFRNTSPNPSSRKFYSYSTIAKVLNMPYNTVQYLCRKALLPNKPKT